MYGFPLTIFLFSGWLQTHYPGIDWFAHDSGHLLETMFGWKSNPHFGPFHIASFVFIVVYMLCSIAAPVLLRKTGEAKPGDYIMGGLGTVLMVLSLIGSVYPVPAYPYNILPYGFAIYMVLGVLWFLALKIRVPHILSGVEHELEVAVA